MTLTISGLKIEISRNSTSEKNPLTSIIIINRFYLVLLEDNFHCFTLGTIIVIVLFYEKSKKNGLAKKYYKLALQFNPVYYLTLMRVGELYRRSGKIKTSMKYFYKAKASCGVCYDPIKAISHNYVA